jgi:hypothetical protein
MGPSCTDDRRRASTGSELEPVVLGPLRAHALAPAFAREVARVHARYAVEVVAAWGLCPFLKDPATAFGTFAVMLDTRLDIEAVLAFAKDAAVGVSHVVYPLVRPSPFAFERFSNDIGERLREVMEKRPVLAAFHPELAGDAEAPHRLVGLLRRAPDPFVQFVPEGLHEGGTVFAGAGYEPPKDPARANFDKLRGAELDRLIHTLEDVRADRDRAYARFADPLIRAAATPP